MKSTYFAKKPRVTLKIIFGHITAYSWSHYNFIESHITSLFMVTLQAYLWSHYKLIYGHITIWLFYCSLWFQLRFKHICWVRAWQYFLKHGCSYHTRPKVRILNCQVYLQYFVCFVYLVYLVYLSTKLSI